MIINSLTVRIILWSFGGTTWSSHYETCGYFEKPVIDPNTWIFKPLGKQGLNMFKSLDEMGSPFSDKPSWIGSWISLNKYGEGSRKN